MKRGFPRPLTRLDYVRAGYERDWKKVSFPHPYAANENSIAAINRGRNKECVYFKKCMNCGTPVKEEVVGLLLFNDQHIDFDQHKDWIHSETGPYHIKCLHQSLTLCPHLAEKGRFVPGYGEWRMVKPLVMEYVVKASS